MSFLPNLRVAAVALVALLASLPAEAAVPLQLPAGEKPEDWKTAIALSLGGLAIGAPGTGPSLVVTGGTEYWKLRVIDGTGKIHELTVLPPLSDADREDMLWLGIDILKKTGAFDAPPAAPAPTAPVAAAPAPVSAPAATKPAAAPAPVATAPSAVPPAAPAPAATKPAAAPAPAPAPAPVATAPSAVPPAAPAPAATKPAAAPAPAPVATKPAPAPAPAAADPASSTTATAVSAVTASTSATAAAPAQPAASQVADTSASTSTVARSPSEGGVAIWADVGGGAALRGAVRTSADLHVIAGAALLGGRLPIGLGVALRPTSEVDLNGLANVAATDVLATARYTLASGAVQPYAGLLGGMSVRGWSTESGDSATVTVPFAGLEAGARVAFAGPVGASVWLQGRQDLRTVMLSVAGADPARVPGTEVRIGAAATFVLPLP
jgi:hypothetical protein